MAASTGGAAMVNERRMTMTSDENKGFFEAEKLFDAHE
jgi:hypothetical protein